MTLGSVQPVLTSELRVIPLPDGSLHLNDATKWETTQLPKDVIINLVKLPYPHCMSYTRV